MHGFHTVFFQFFWRVPRDDRPKNGLAKILVQPRCLFSPRHRQEGCFGCFGCFFFKTITFLAFFSSPAPKVTGGSILVSWVALFVFFVCWIFRFVFFREPMLTLL